jgi:hypothetical protein
VDRSEAQVILGLPDLERASAIENLMDDNDWTPVKVARELGVPVNAVMLYLSKTRSTMSSGIVIEYWDDRYNQSYASMPYDPIKYAELWQRGNLKFQREGKPRPAHYPDLGTVKS